MKVDVIQFKKEEPKKGFKYTILRFPKNTRNNLIGKHAGIVDLDGAFIVLPLDKKESVITQESLNEKISKVRQSLERQIRVITEINPSNNGILKNKPARASPDAGVAATTGISDPFSL
ncbi:hypothetical protein [Methanosphaerula subterraneus]|uniref:hypothetical protein n=1 Tax=Methanosphaerula subterraneus TaxID=3350244 RepID=UPI003F85EFB6